MSRQMSPLGSHSFGTRTLQSALDQYAAVRKIAAVDHAALGLGSVVKYSPRSPASRRFKSSYFRLNYGSANLCRGHTTSLNACSRVLLADPRTAIGGMPGHDGVNNRAAESTDPVLDIKQFILPHIKHFIPIVQRHIAHKVTLPTFNHKLYIYVYIYI